MLQDTHGWWTGGPWGQGDQQGATHGSGVYMGLEAWRMYCVEWNTRKASPARKSLEDSRPATGRSRKPVHAGTPEGAGFRLQRGRNSRKNTSSRLGEFPGGSGSSERIVMVSLHTLYNPYLVKVNLVRWVTNP